jgi:hypothetical protein
MEATPQDKLAASVFSVGLVHGLTSREEVVNWADRRIESTDTPPQWLIDLSLSQNLHLLDIVGLLERVAEGVDPVTTCRAVYALFPDAAGLSLDEATSLSSQLYQVTLHTLDGDWNDLMSEVTHIDDSFSLLPYIDLTERGAVLQLHEFIERHRNPDVVGFLRGR